MQKVKIQVYSAYNEATYVDSFEGKDFGDFVLISLNMAALPPEELQSLHQAFQDAVTDGRKVIVTDNSIDIDVFGFKETADDT